MNIYRCCITRSPNNYPDCFRVAAHLLEKEEHLTMTLGYRGQFYTPLRLTTSPAMTDLACFTVAV